MSDRRDAFDPASDGRIEHAASLAGRHSVGLTGFLAVDAIVKCAIWAVATLAFIQSLIH